MNRCRYCGRYFTDLFRRRPGRNTAELSLEEHYFLCGVRARLKGDQRREELAQREAARR